MSLYFKKLNLNRIRSPIVWQILVEWRDTLFVGCVNLQIVFLYLLVAQFNPPIIEE